MKKRVSIAVGNSPAPSAQGPLIDYALHTLGWKSFQDLCVAIAQEVLKRPVETFLPSKDGGRDGAFLGRWSNGNSANRSTIQCKFTSKADAPLNLSAVKSELTKAGKLAARGLAEDYILLTNHRVSGTQAGEIAAAFEAVGVKNCVILGRDWVAQQIRESSRLRVMVPRVYGLGDLSQILDERAYAQSRAVLSALGDDLACFVVTDAHRQSVDALLDHNFVLLLGDPGTPSVTAALPVAIATGLKSALESELRSGRWVRSRCFRGRSVGGDGARRSGLRFSPQRFSLVPALPTSHASMTSPPP